MQSSTQVRPAHIPRLDSLRAIAVTLVLMFHLAPKTIPWGFLGVDMFFIISGFLMTYLYLRAGPVDDNLGKAFEFLKRRFWRLYPPLILTIFFTVLLGCLFLSPNHLNETAKSGLYSAVFASNWYFFSQSDYFDFDSIFKPLLHTWSLGVEEQFYVFFALALAFRNHIDLQKTLWVVGILSTGLWLMVVITNHFPRVSGLDLPSVHDEPISAIFYLPQYRAFQFASGGIAAALMLRGIRLPKWSSGLALCAVLVGFVLGHDQSTAHLSAIPTTIGMMLLVWQSSVLDSMAALPIVRYIAKVSYHLYLVHWPIIVFWHYVTVTPFSLAEMLAIVALCLALSELLFRITDPMRMGR